MVFGNNGSSFANFLQRYKNHEFEQAVINISLGVVVSAIALSIILSLIFPKEKKEETEETGETEETAQEQPEKPSS